MKTFYSLLMAIGLAAPMFAADHQTFVLNTSAKAFDNLISRTAVEYEEVIKPGKRERKPAPPVPDESITTAVSTRLKISEAEIARILQENRIKLSDVVMARMLEESGEKPWNELLAEGRTTPDLIKLIEERRITARVKNIFDELYADVSIAVLDSIQAQEGKGSAPGSSKGSGKSK